MWVTEPFARGFVPDRPFVLRVPNGYVLDTVNPEPDERDGRKVTRESGTDLTGLSVELEAQDTPTRDDTTGTDGQPGVGWLVARLALLGARKLVASKP